MKIKHLTISVLIILLTSAIVSASMLIPANENAIEHSPIIGENGALDRVDFIHYAKPTGSAKATIPTCYKLLGVKWNNLPVNYVINPTSFSEKFVTDAVSTSAETWDTTTSKELFNNLYKINYNAQYGIQNFENAITFGDYPNNNVIAVTSIWFTRVGKQIVEFDILFNTRFNWGDATINPTIMDLQNIATHELGHAVGLNDIYSSTCSAVTMYGYSNYGETSKRTLEQPDILGLQKMYGI